jgi:hypothetical protein
MKRWKSFPTSAGNLLYLFTESRNSQSVAAFLFFIVESTPKSNYYENNDKIRILLHCNTVSCGLPVHAGPGGIGLFGVDS